jgi:hypothetical protein
VGAGLSGLSLPAADQATAASTTAANVPRMTLPPTVGARQKV